MGRIRSFITFLALIGLTSISAAAMVQVLRTGLPERTLRTPVEVLRWLTVNDFAQAEPGVQRRLIRRMEEDFNRDIDWNAMVNTLDDEQLATFTDNFSELMRVWFLNKVDDYFALPNEEQQRRYLRDQMTTIFNWKIPFDDVVLEVQDADQGNAGGRRGQDSEQQPRLGAFFRWEDQFLSWQERSTPEEQQKIAQFVTEVTVYLMQLRESGENWPRDNRQEFRRGPFRGDH